MGRGQCSSRSTWRASGHSCLGRENQIVFQVGNDVGGWWPLEGGSGVPDYCIGPWLGGSDAEVEGQWKWVTENHGHGPIGGLSSELMMVRGEDHLMLLAQGVLVPTPDWADAGGECGPYPKSFVVEWSSYKGPEDFNENGIVDSCELDIDDCDNNGVPDECQSDEDADGIPDVCDDDADNDGVPNDCDADYSDALIQYQGSSYLVVGDSESGSLYCSADAKEIASDLGGELVSFETEEELLDVMSQIDQLGLVDGCIIIHIGLQQDEGAGEPAAGWRWVNGAPLTYDRWASTLDDAAGCQDTGAVDLCGFDFDDVYPCPGECTFSSLGYVLVEFSPKDCDGDGILDICQLEGNDCDNNGLPDQCDPDSDSDGLPNACDDDVDGDGISNECDVDFAGQFASSAIQWPENGHWYAAVADVVSWTDAQNRAEQLGGYLATMTSESENQFIFNNILNEESLWNYGVPLGGNNPVGHGPFFGAVRSDIVDPTSEFSWVSGEPWQWETGLSKKADRTARGMLSLMPTSTAKISPASRINGTT